MTLLKQKMVVLSNAFDEGALDIIAKRLRLGDKDIDEFMVTLMKMYKLNG